MSVAKGGWSEPQKTTHSGTLAGMRTAGSYARLSVYRDGSKSESVERQQGDLQTLASQRELTITKEYSDRDVSAFHDVKRPGYDQALQDLADGIISDLLCWDISRLTRKGLRGVVEILEALHQNPGSKLHLLHTPVDTSTPLGEAVLGLFASVAEEESRSISRRVTSYHLSVAQKGLPHTGGQRGFGYSTSKLDDGTATLIQVPEEVELIREMAERILAGESRSEIARDLNSRGLKTSTGKPWTQSSLDMLLKQSRLFGMREYKGNLFQGDWEPVFTPEEFAEIQASLRSTMQERRDHAGESPPLLAKLIKCSLCGFTMSVAHSRANGKPYRRYMCSGTKNCGRTAVGTDKADKQVIRVLSSLRLPVAKPNGGNGEEVAEAQARLSAWDSQFLSKALDPTVWSEHRPALVTDVDAALAALDTRKASKGALEALSSGPEWWETASPAEKRRTVLGAVPEVLCLPFESHSKDRLRVRLNWSALLGLAGVDPESLSEEEYEAQYLAL